MHEIAWWVSKYTLKWNFEIINHIIAIGTLDKTISHQLIVLVYFLYYLLTILVITVQISNNLHICTAKRHCPAQTWDLQFITWQFTGICSPSVQRQSITSEIHTADNLAKCLCSPWQLVIRWEEYVQYHYRQWILCCGWKRQTLLALAVLQKYHYARPTTLCVVLSVKIHIEQCLFPLHSRKEPLH